jgi:hypothetical protein
VKLGFDFVPFPRDIWIDGLDLSQAEFRLLGWFCFDLKWGVRKLEVTDEDILNGCEKEGRKVPAVGLSRNGMKSARESLVQRGILVATQITDGGGRGKSTSWAYSLNLSESDKNPETCHSVTPNLSQRDKFSPVNLSQRDTAIRKEKENTEETETSPSAPECPSLFTLPDDKTKVQVLDSTLHIDKLFNYFRHVTGKSDRYTLTKKRSQMAANRWKEALQITKGNTEEAKKIFRDVIDAIASSEFHQKNGFVEWEQLFRSEDNFTKWAERAENSPDAA